MDLLETEKETWSNQIKCDFCDLYITDESNLDTHISDVYCDFCDLVKSKRSLKVHKTKKHTKTIDTQTKIFEVFTPLKYSGKYVGDNGTRKR